LLRRLLTLLSGERSLLGWWIALVVLSIVFAGLELVSSLAVLTLIRLVVADAPSATGGIGGLPFPTPNWFEGAVTVPSLAVGLLLLFVARSVLMVAIAYLGGRLSRMAGVRIARGLLDGYLHLPFSQLAQRRSAEMVRETFVSTELLHEKATRPLTSLVTDAVVTTGLIAALVMVDPSTTVVAGVFLTAATLLVQRAVRPRLRRWSRLSQDATSNSLEVLQQAISGLRDIRLLGQEKRFLDAHDRQRSDLARFRYLGNALRSVPRSILELATIGAIVVLILVVARTEGGTVDIVPVLGMFAYVGLRLQPILNRIISHVNELRSSEALIDDLLAEQQRLAEAPRPRPADAPQRPVTSHEIRLDRVSFSYPETDDRPACSVLKSVDLTIPEGAFVVIVGPSGAGKSTLLDLILGLIPPASGTVSVGGTPLGAAPRWWWQELGVVSQSIYLAPGTIRENVAFGTPDPTDPTIEGRIAESLAVAQLTDVVDALPHGLDTQIGEGGDRLSGGQRQRIALARAFFRDPAVIVLDEGTAALDSETESSVITALRTTPRQSGGRRTLVVVTHRATMVPSADLLVEVVDGRVTHRSLP
jgi:ABC-type multidrug transport system fused ATPase/permease subunit